MPGLQLPAPELMRRGSALLAFMLLGLAALPGSHHTHGKLPPLPSAPASRFPCLPGLEYLYSGTLAAAAAATVEALAALLLLPSGTALPTRHTTLVWVTCGTGNSIEETPAVLNHDHFGGFPPEGHGGGGVVLAGAPGAERQLQRIWSQNRCHSWPGNTQHCAQCPSTLPASALNPAG